MGAMFHSLGDWPWTILGSWKYILFFPLVAKTVHANFYGGYDIHNFCFHVLLLSLLRYILHEVWQSLCRMLFLVKRLLVRTTESIDYHQIDREWHWDNYLILQALLITAAHTWLPVFNNLSVWNSKGIFYLLVLHGSLAEPLYYMIHRAFHTEFLFANFHSLHHVSVTTEPSTAGTTTFLEQVVLAIVMAVPIFGTCLLGAGSVGMLYVYLLGFDFLNCLGHCNVEIVPLWPFRVFPPLRYLLYTPSYHALHHENLNSNFCLFMPLYDYLGGTIDNMTVSLHAELRNGRKERERPPDFVFLLHMVDIMSSMHSPFIFRAFASLPYTPQWFLFPFWPVAFLVAIAMWIWAQNFAVWRYYIRDRFHEIWIVPRFGFHYFIPAAKNGINKLIEKAILDADKRGVKVIGLAALNKNEALNGGGTLFVEKHENLKVRVVHGNTLTAAVILNTIPKDTKEVFLAGATSKLGRAIALYLCRKGLRVMMMTGSRERFQSIQKEAPVECEQNLVHVTKCQAGRNCRTWIVGKWLGYREQKMAPPGTHFHQFVVPMLIPFRNDCTYGKLASIRLPEDVKGLSCCEYALERQVVHACHAGGVVHALEGWDHHEVGAIDVNRIDVVWEAALKNGLTFV